MEFENQQKIEGRKLKINKVSMDLKTIEGKDYVHRVAFETDKGRITVKPKEEVKQMIAGIEAMNKRSCSINNIPESIKDIGREVKEKGFCTVIATYIVAECLADGEMKEYRWIQGQKMLESWKVVGEEHSPITEKVEKTAY